MGSSASHATLGTQIYTYQTPGPIYGNDYLLPLQGGSGGGGGDTVGGNGGGGAILIAVSGTLSIEGQVQARGGTGGTALGGLGSGGTIRLISSRIIGDGHVDTIGSYSGGGHGGNGRVRLEAYVDAFSGHADGASVTYGLQNVIILPANASPSILIASIADIPVPVYPTSSLSSPDVLIPGATENPMTIVVNCLNMPLNSPVTVTVNPVHGAAVRGVATNATGTDAASTASAALNIPIGAGTICATATVTISTGGESGEKMSYLDTGLAANGDRFKLAELFTTAGGRLQTTLITESGKRFPLSAASEFIRK
jgi:hypothetical protein